MPLTASFTATAGGGRATTSRRVSMLNPAGRRHSHSLSHSFWVQRRSRVSSRIDRQNFISLFYWPIQCGTGTTFNILTSSLHFNALRLLLKGCLVWDNSKHPPSLSLWRASPFGARQCRLRNDLDIHLGKCQCFHYLPDPLDRIYKQVPSESRTEF